MKKFARIIAVALLVVMALSLVSCSSSFGSIKSNFEKHGYTYVKDADSESTSKTITAELEQGDISCTPHLFKTDGFLGVDVYALVLEFGSDKDMQAAMEESATIQGLVKDAQESQLVNGNCLLIPISLTKADDMIKIFNGEKLD
mgnify:CR=1 FL=1